MPKLISATYHPNIEVAEFICEDGRHLLRSGGTLPWRINNPGDLTARMVDGVPAPRKAKGYVGFATTRSGRTFLIFPDEDAGREELKANLKRLHGDRTIPEAIPVYAPKKENDTEKYARDLLKTSGIPASRKIGECSDAELEKIVNSIAEIEGYHANAETRKETWVAVSRINATDGSQPLPDAEIILQRGGKEETVKSDATGRFPPVIHPADKSAVHVKVAEPKSKKAVVVGIIEGDVGKDFNLLAKFRRWKGVAGSEKVNSSTVGQRKPMSYVVQPGDSLWKIAKLYRTSVAGIKEASGLDRDRIYPGEVLLITGSGKAKPDGRSSNPPSLAAKPPPVSAPASPGAPPKRVRVSAPAPPPVLSGIRSSDSERSKEGTGKVLALINAMPDRAPWMAIAIAEAKLRYGKGEDVLEKEIDYHVEIGDGSKFLSRRAWCAAFANWCLLKAGYPVDNVGFRDRRATLGRAHGFYEMDEEKNIRNPLFVELGQPIYGAIAIATRKNGHGYHVGFAYGKEGKGNLILLGGNQEDRIQFSPFNMEPEKMVEVIEKSGRKRRKIVKSPSYLRYFVPVSYHEQAKKDLANSGLSSMDVDALNGVIGVPPRPKRKKPETKTD
ncbi:LysM peptidoglycan-binding domain-containing protein [Variovorax sp. NFACC27]|uniref:LysM peptidoglycan-binding domain-containing protein n=1 Tax=unclassified Variovorax TaxID=663243 RepID=UPI000894227E|nr:TIGR02594 family protein [Variovorax sp. NFACC28]SEG95746.1 TIGR02594 family protein [Variovorax sp. NFACC29]SFD79148.1 TIGR02594 family protein [Variovorax sp. NFACC26]SFG92834.1 TIGR02594 family protein [Variovorax sp. NFACC27]